MFPASGAIWRLLCAIVRGVSAPVFVGVLPTGGCSGFGSPTGSHSAEARCSGASVSAVMSLSPSSSKPQQWWQRMRLSAGRNAISEVGCGQVFCLAVGTTAGGFSGGSEAPELVPFVVLREGDCVGGSGRLGWSSWATRGGGSGRLPSFDSSLLLEAGVAEKWD
jgi:hypothetical protein